MPTDDSLLSPCPPGVAPPLKRAPSPKRMLRISSKCQTQGYKCTNLFASTRNCLKASVGTASHMEYPSSQFCFPLSFRAVVLALKISLRACSLGNSSERVDSSNHFQTGIWELDPPPSSSNEDLSLLLAGVQIASGMLPQWNWDGIQEEENMLLMGILRYLRGSGKVIIIRIMESDGCCQKLGRHWGKNKIKMMRVIHYQYKWNVKARRPWQHVRRLIPVAEAQALSKGIAQKDIFNHLLQGTD